MRTFMVGNLNKHEIGILFKSATITIMKEVEQDDNEYKDEVKPDLLNLIVWHKMNYLPIEFDIAFEFKDNKVFRMNEKHEWEEIESALAEGED